MNSVDTVKAIYVAFTRGDMATVRNLMAEDIVWIEPEGYFVPEGRGRTVGRDRVMEIFARYADYWQEFSVTADEVYDAGEGTVLVIGRQIARARANGRSFEGGFANFWTVRAGKLSKHVSFSDTKAVAAVLGTP